MAPTDALYFPLDRFAETEGEFAPRAHAVAEVPFEGKNRRFLLRVVGNFLFFVEENNQDFEPIFGLTRPLASSHQAARVFADAPQILCHLFAREFAALRWGVCLFRNEVYFGATGCGIFLPDGSGVVRPWWDDRAGIPFRYDAKRWDTPAALLDWRRPTDDEIKAVPKAQRHDYWERCWEFEEHFDVPAKDPALIKKFQSRTALPRHRDPYARPFVWTRGSEAEAIQLTRHIWQLARHVWQEHPEMPHLTLKYQSATPHYLADWKCHLEPTRWNHNSFSIIWHGLLARYHYPVGAVWVHQWEEDAEPPRRVWDLSPYGQEWTVERPTAHDTMEATLALRDWLRGKVSDEDAQHLLQIADEPEAWAQNNLYSELYKRYL